MYKLFFFSSKPNYIYGARFFFPSAISYNLLLDKWIDMALESDLNLNIYGTSWVYFHTRAAWLLFIRICLFVGILLLIDYLRD